jgi:hypothetical protein
MTDAGNGSCFPVAPFAFLPNSLERAKALTLFAGLVVSWRASNPELVGAE